MMSREFAHFFDWIISVINFGVMFYLFRLVVIVPMQEAVKLREQRVRLRLAEIEAIASEARAKQSEFEGKFGNVESTLAEIKTSAERSLAQARTKISEKAEAEERYILEKAGVEAAGLRREVETEIRTRIAGEAVTRAEAILSKTLDAAAQNSIVAAGVKRVGELHAT
jgi:F0F1-type ATP synthase membrane subunit b/b'